MSYLSFVLWVQFTILAKSIFNNIFLSALGSMKKAGWWPVPSYSWLLT